jgi:hypothetical protein
LAPAALVCPGVSNGAREEPNSLKFDAEAPRKLFAVNIRALDSWAYAVAPDGRFLADVSVTEPDRSLVVVLNWPAALPRQQ